MSDPLTEKPHQLNLDFKGEPRFPRSVAVAGVIWILLGGLSVLSAVVLLLLFRHSFDSSVPGIDGGKFLASLCGPVLLLFGVLFLLAGFRILRGAERGTLSYGVSSLAVGAWFLVNVFNACYSIVSLALLPRNYSIGPYGDSAFEQGVILAVPQLILGLLLLTAGRLALTDGSQYQLWRQAQIDRRKAEKKARLERS